MNHTDGAATPAAPPSDALFPVEPGQQQPDQDPDRPGDPQPTRSAGKRAKRRRTRVHEGWDGITPRLRDWAAEKVPGVDVDAETEQFVDHHAGAGTLGDDWEARWRVWMRNAHQWGRGGGKGRAATTRGGPSNRHRDTTDDPARAAAWTG